MNTSFGLKHFWQQGDAIAHFVALILILMSIISWIVIVYKAMHFLRVNQYAKNVNAQFWHSKNFSEGLQQLGEAKQPNEFRTLALDGIHAIEHHAQNKDDLHGALDASEWLSSCLRRTLDNSSASLNNGLSILASIGSTAPFIGLFGTVWGIYHALINIGQSGQVGLEQVAGPIGEALIMTALGLAVAIPAVLGYNTLLRQQKSLMAHMHNFAHDLHAYFITGARVRGQTATNLNKANTHTDAKTQ